MANNAWTSSGSGATAYPTLMGWNQTVSLTYDGVTTKVKVRDFSVGITQKYEVPDLVTGATDRMTWSKGVIEVGGSINAPLTASLSSSLVKAANEAAIGEGDITVASSVHGSMQCKVNTCRISCDAEGPIEVSADLFGRLGKYLNSSTASLSSCVTAIGGSAGTVYGTNGGADPSGLTLEEIPMFDQVVVNFGMLPATCDYLQPIGVTFTIDNKLTRNYVLGAIGGDCATEGDGGDVTNGSSLDAFSISAGQRALSGTMKFQSGTTGRIAYNQNAGTGTTSSDPFLNFANLVSISGETYVPVWSAAPPQLNTGKVVVELEYQLLATTPGFGITVS